MQNFKCQSQLECKIRWFLYFCIFWFFGQKFDQKLNPNWLFTMSLILWSNFWIFLEFPLLKWNWIWKESFYAKSPNLTLSWLLVKWLTKKSTRKSTVWLFGFLHEMNRKLFTKARPTDNLKNDTFCSRNGFRFDWKP